VLLALSELCAFGYFIKAALVPLVLTGVEVCLWKETEPKARRRNGAAILLSLLVAALYVSVWFVRAVPDARAVAPNGRYLWRGAVWSWRVLLDATLGFPPDATLGFPPRGVVPIVCASILWLGAVAFSTWKRRSNVAAWLWLVVIVSVSIFMTLAPLSRYVLFQRAPHETLHRYYVELMAPFVLFAALGFRKVLSARPPGKAGEALVAAVLVVSAVHSYRGARALLTEPFYANYGKQKEFIENLEHDLRPLLASGDEVVIVDGELPPFALGWGDEWRRQSKLLEAMGISVNFGRSGKYRITDKGHVVRIRR